MARPDFPWARRRRERVTFRGVEGEMIVSRRTGGHRLTVHEYLGLDEPYGEDHGLRAARFNVEWVVTGDNYDRDLASLLAALKQRGRGRLSLWFGDPIWVLVDSWDIVERATGAGLARVTIDFVEAGVPRYPETGLGGQSLLASGISRLEASAAAAFPTATDGLAEVTSLGSAMGDRALDLSDSLTSSMEDIDRSGGQAANFASDLALFVDSAASLGTNAEGLATEVVSLLEGLSQIPGGVGRTFAAMGSLTTWGASLDPVTGSTPTAVQEAANQAALAALVARLAATRAAEAAVSMEYASAQEATSQRDALTTLLDGAILAAGDSGEDDVFRDLRDVKSTAVRDLNARAARLPTRVQIVIARTVPSLVLAHRLYHNQAGDTSAAQGIADRNGLRHPGFVPAGESLEVLGVPPSGG